MADTKIYAIRFCGGSIVNCNGKLALYTSRDLAENDLRAMPDSWTDYDHFEIEELSVISSSDGLIFKR